MTDQPTTQTFATSVTAALGKNPKLKVNATAIEQTAAYFDSWAGMVAYGGEDGAGFTDFGWTAEEAPVVLRVAKSEAADEAGLQSPSVSVHVAAAVTEAAPPPQVNPYTAALSGGLINSAALGHRVSKETLARFADTVAAFIFLGQGVDKIFTPQFFGEQAKRNPGDVTAALTPAYVWGKKAQNYEFLSRDEIKQLANAMPDLFGDEWQKLLETATRVSQMSAGADLVQGATFSIDAAAMGEVTQSVPAVAEHFSSQVKATTLPFIAQSAGDMIKSLLEILRSPEFLKAVRYVPTDESPEAIDSALLLFLEQEIGPTIRDTFRLSVAAQNLVTLLGMCPDPVDKMFMSAFSSQAAAYYQSYKSVNGAAGNAGATFRHPSAVEQERRWTFSIDLKVDIRF